MHLTHPSVDLVMLRNTSSRHTNIATPFINAKCLKQHCPLTLNNSSFYQNPLIVPTDARYYKIIEMLKQFKIIILAPTCFGSCRNHHQGAVLCLAKTTEWFFCAHQYRHSQC